MTRFARALVEFGASGRESIDRAHAAAIAVGANFTGTTHDSESAASTQDLLCVAGDAAVDMAMLAQVFEADSSPDRARALRLAAAGVARMTARALEVHARDGGYDPTVWIGEARDETAQLMTDDHDGLFVAERTLGESVAVARCTASHIFAALACAPRDRMGVPGHIAAALGGSVSLYMVATAGTE